jgi:hypothetical protein
MATTTFTIGQKVERKGKFYIVSDPSIHEGATVAVRCINKKTGQAWQAPMYFPASEVSPT